MYLEHQAFQLAQDESSAKASARKRPFGGVAFGRGSVFFWPPAMENLQCSCTSGPQIRCKFVLVFSSIGSNSARQLDALGIMGVILPKFQSDANLRVKMRGQGSSANFSGQSLFCST